MAHHNTIFAQLLKLVPRHEFESLAHQHHVGQKLRKMSRWSQHDAFCLAQVAGRSSLRDIVSNLSAQAVKLYHLGSTRVTRTSLARINERQPYTLYEALFYKLLARCHGLAPRHGFRFKNKLYSLDSTTIDQYDFRVALFDSIELGSQIPGSLAPVYEDINVEAGLVNLAIDFGVGVFNGEPRFIQFEVREATSTGNYTILQPRQQVFPSPEALNSAALGGDVFQRGTIGDCTVPGSTGATGSVTFPKAFSEPPLVFLSPNESADNRGCVAITLFSRDAVGFAWASFSVDGAHACDCIHWLAVGPL